MSIRICGGLYRSIRLECPARGVRPTTDRVKEAIFSILGDDVPGSNVLDLFAGCGSLGIESLSRGAQHASFVEKSRVCTEVIAQNLKTIEAGERATIIRGDARSFMKTCTSGFDLIFMDPPYNKALASTLAPHVYKLLNSGGVLVIEHSPAEPLELAAWKHKTYGDTAVSFFRKG
ncbi:MAG: 16S rRNA (guanine(966)-N(2))-methyltransferase RsmD [Desulfomonilia bacterium]